MRYQWMAIVLGIIIGLSHQVPLTSEHMHGLSKLSGAVLNPDNKYAVYAVKEWNKETGKATQHLEYTDVVTKKVKLLTEGKEGQSDSTPVFSAAFPDYVLFKRVINGKGAIYYLPFPSEKQEPQQLTNYPIEVVDFKLGGLSLVFSTGVYFDCDTILCSVERIAIEKERTWQGYNSLLMFHWDEWLPEGKGSHIFLQKLSFINKIIALEGEPIDITKGMEINSPPLLTDNTNYDVSRDGSSIAFSGHFRTKTEAWSTAWRTYYYNINDKTPILITNHTDATTQTPKFSKDGTKIAYLAMKTPMLESENLHMEIYHILTNRREIIDDELDLSITNYAWFNDYSFFFSATNFGVEKIYKLKVLEADKPKYEAWKVGDESYSYTSPIFGLFSNGKALTIKSGFDFPDELVTFDLTGNGKEDFVTQLNKEKLQDIQLVKAESFKFIGGYGDEVQGWIMKPIDYIEGQKYPVGLLIHGGPESSWTTGFSYRWNPQLWVSHGYVIIMINPHGSTGRGTSFRDAVRTDWGGVPYKDIMAGVEYVKQTYSYPDTTNMCACGGSYGGYMVNWIQGQTDIFKCFVNHDGAFSTISKFYSTDALWFQKAEYCPRDNIDCNPFDNETIRQEFEKFSPERYVKNWKTPMLVIHGGMDYRVPLTEALSTFTILQLLNIKSKLLYFPIENHWVLKPENSIKWTFEVLSWMDAYLKTTQ